MGSEYSVLGFLFAFLFLGIVTLAISLKIKEDKRIKKQTERNNKIRSFYNYRTSMLPELTNREINAERVQDFFSNCAEIEKMIREMKTYENKIDDIKIRYNSGPEYDLTNFERVYKNEKPWRLRDAIERHARQAVKNNESLYKNSREKQHLVYYDFINGITNHFSELDNDTLELFYRCEEKVYFSTDGAVKRFQGKTTTQTTASDTPLLRRIDSMSGEEFESFCADLLQNSGFTKVRLTQGSGDQGVDILAEKDGVTYAIQCKCYSSPLGNKPIQEVHAGKDIYGCHVGVVLTNSTFTPGANKAADKTHTLLWDRNKLIELISKSNEKRA